ncbi:MAG: 3-deoxy-manno-octulosonate cytidylyltransferase [Puniceicoccales bacterium]|jgi:3-deoxy-manno-octulosonate cytidylyltransferase (CMP-KDO synthetase)|nr:3-deoxy-manno-octulosonate cytidylyltransferase [Puniceicoccales bacterium]
MKVSIVIPARLQSSRFPRKILQNLGGIPLLRRVLERVGKLQSADEIIALVDDENVLQRVSQWGFHGILTAKDCISGTERVVSVAGQLAGDFAISVQGDEPFIATDLLEKMIAAAKSAGAKNAPLSVWTAIYPIASSEMLFNPNRVKVVVDKNDRAIYFSRAPIPFLRDVKDREQWPECYPFWGHVGVYGYSKEILTQYPFLKEGILERAERLEQLRLLENGIPFQCLRAQEPSISIDTPEDLAAAETFLASHPEF